MRDAVGPLGFPVSRVPSLIAALSSQDPSKLAGIASHIVRASEEAIRWGYTDAFKVVWLVSIPSGVVALLFAAIVRDPSPFFTKHTAVTLEKVRVRDKRGRDTKKEVDNTKLDHELFRSEHVEDARL